MGFMCPVCNGLEPFQETCAFCGAAAADNGRLNDYFGPYSPYRPIDDAALTNGYPDVASHQCVHVAQCTACGKVFHSLIREWPSR